MGIISRGMAMKLFVMMLVACAVAHQTEYYNLENDIAAPPGETYGDVEMLQEDAGVKMKADVVYRISWNTKWDTVPSKTASKDTISITIEGKDGATTGAQVLVSHPGYSCGAAADAACAVDITGNRVADGDASIECNCDPAADGYDEAAAKWSIPSSGASQSMYLNAVDVVEITKVTVTSDGTDSWKPGFLKINMNSAETGLGNGIYYMDIGKKIDSNLPFEVSTDAVDSNGEKIDMTRKSSHKYGIIKCEASACEEEMEKKMAMETEAVKK